MSESCLGLRAGIHRLGFFEIKEGAMGLSGWAKVQADRRLGQDGAIERGES